MLAYFYTRATGEVLDISKLTEPEEQYLRRCLAAYDAALKLDDKDLAWASFSSTYTFSAENPALVNGRLTSAGADHPLFRAVLDLETRLGMLAGRFGTTPETDLERHPVDDDVSLTITAAAEMAGVTRVTIYNALASGELVGMTGRPGRVSRNSLSRWQPDTARQMAGRLAAAR